MSLEKVAGSENPGDAMTKYLHAPELLAHGARMNLVYEEGRAQSAPQLTASVLASTHEHKEVIREERRKWDRESTGKLGMVWWCASGKFSRTQMVMG